MGKIDTLLEQLRDEYDVPEDVIEGLSGSALRKELKEAQARASKADQYEKQLETISKAPKRNEIFRELGVDVDSLPAYGKKVLEQFDWEGDTPDKEAVAAFITANELPTSEIEVTETSAPPAAQAVVGHVTSATHRADRSATLTSEVVGTWDTQKIMRFKEQHPTEFEELKKGNSVVGITFN